MLRNVAVTNAVTSRRSILNGALSIVAASAVGTPASAGTAATVDTSALPTLQEQWQ
jgi:hypothetical protein